MTIPELRTSRLLMRGWRDSDLDAWAAICRDVEVMRWFGSRHGMDREEAWRNMAYLCGHWSLKGFGQWALEELGTGELVGRAGLLHPEGWPGPELGWLMARRFWGRGYATEAARASMDWARDELGAIHLIALIDDDNQRSQRVAEKLGMAPEGRATVRGDQEFRVFGRDL